jgi:CRP-like cAMP-binding protein
MTFDQILKNISETVELNNDEKDVFTSLLKLVTFKKKQFVVQAGAVCHEAVFVLKGCLKISYIDRNGTEHVVKFAVENWWAFDLGSFTTRAPAFYRIQALEDTETFVLSRSGYDLLFDRVPKFERFFRLMFQQSYIQLQNRLTQNLYSDGEEKYHHFTEKYPGLELRIAQKEIAAYLGITPEFLSMLRKKRKTHPIS